MRYVIDGYNLLHAMGLLGGRTGPHGLEKARLALLSRLHHVLGEAGGSITVVFDARQAPRCVLTADDYHGIHVCFTTDCEADDHIEELIRLEGTPHLLTVVSDDRRVRDAARRRHCPVLRCLDYLDALEKQRRQPQPAPTPQADKPDAVSPAEAEQWLHEFGDLARDARLRELFGPDFEDEAG
jgi:hypothetical protein